MKKQYLIYAALLLAGIIIGWLIPRSSAAGEEGEGDKQKTTYTCSMDPQIKQDHPGKCPICGMDLIPMSSYTGESGVDPDAVMMSDEALALANVETEIVGGEIGAKEIRLFGKIQPDERLQQTQAAYVAGRIERLNVSAVGDVVGKGQTIAVIYSPELYTAAQELVAAMKIGNEQQRQLMTEAAKEKLRLLNMQQAQIDGIVKSGKASPYVAVKANTSGTVVSKEVSQGDYVKQGQPILRIANLSRVWAVFQAYESDLPFIKKGQTVRFSAEAMPGRSFDGRVSFVDPVLDGKTRTAGVRVVMNNPGGIFKPEMLVEGVAAASMKQYSEDIVVPKSAVLWTGKRSVVYVKDDTEEQPTFKLRTITLGPSLPDGYVVLEGLAEGEEIVTNGVFAVDASAQLEGKKSMMNND